MKAVMKNPFSTLAICTALLSSGAFAAQDCDIRYGASPTLARLDVKVGDRFTVCLDANPSTGFSWVMPFGKSEGLERLAYLGSQYRPGAAQAQGMVGGAETHVFHFAAAKPGSARLTLDYLRPWLWQQAPARSVVFEITILPGQGADTE
jgi:predicted secreted protein